MHVLFSDFQIVEVMSDPLSPGVFIKAVKPENFIEADLGGHELYSMITGHRSLMVSEKEIADFLSHRRIREMFRGIERGFRRLRNLLLGRRQVDA